MQKLSMAFEVKSVGDDVDPEFFTFEGYASTSGNVDGGGDRVIYGAFGDTINTWVSKAKRLPILWQHDMHMPLGVFTELREDANGLFVKGRMPKSDTFVSGRVIPQMKVGSVTDMSIGYYALDFDYVDGGKIRNLKKLDLCEVSLVTMPMNSRANVTAMKSLNKINDLPLAPSNHVWSPVESLARVSALPQDLQKSCFLWSNEDENRFLVADVIDGAPHLVLEAVQNAAAAVQSGYKLPEGSIEELKSSIEFYYKKFGKDAPFQEKTCITLESIGFLTEREIERILKKGVCFSDTQAKLIVKSIMSTRREDAVDTEREARIKDITSAFAEFKTL